MPTLEITLKLAPGSKLFGVPIAVEVIDSELETRWRGAIPLGRSATTGDLEGGRYAVQASLPSGRRLSRVVKLSPQRDIKVEIEVVKASRHRSLEWAKLSRPKLLDDADGREAALRSVWLRLWACGPDGRWGVQPWPVQRADRAPGLVQYKFRFGQPERFGQYYLQIGGPKMWWRLVSLPADDICVLVTGARAGAGGLVAAAGPVEVTVTGKRHDADVLLAYLSRGEIEQADLVSSRVVADGLLHGKRRNPMAAAIAGYFLLLKGELQSVHQVWSSNLSRWMTWLPDGAVINAWYLMHADRRDLPAAKRQLLEAAARGVPVYTCGLRLLIDGLALFADDLQHGGPDVVAALKRARRFAAAADWGSPTTAFVGEDPCSPGTRKSGRPADPHGVIFLAEPNDEDLIWKQPGLSPRSRQRRRASGGLMVKGGAEAFDASYAPFERPADREAARSAALGETPEHAPGARAPHAAPAHAPDVRSLTRETLSRYAQLRAAGAAGAAPRPRSLDIDELTVARLFRATDMQTQGEQVGRVSAVRLSPGDASSATLRGLALERIMGVSDLLSVSFLEYGLAAARTVGRAGAPTRDGRSVAYATGFLVSPRLLLTTHHPVGSAARARRGFADFEYHDGPDGRLLTPARVEFDPDAFFVSSPELGFALVALGGPAPGRRFGWSRLSDEQGQILIGEYVSSVQHAEGGPKQLSLRENQLVGGNDDFLHYLSETAPPAPGAPLYNDQWEVVGMHLASAPALKPAGQPLVHEAVRVRSIVKFLRECELPPEAAELRDELLYLSPPA
jgi:hypothetical protein